MAVQDPPRIPPRLELQNITRRFGGQQAVADVSLTLDAGEVICLLGPSGCGKSTTLRIAAGVDRQSSGTVLIDGEVVSDDRHHQEPENRSIGLMFQDFALFPHLDVAGNVGFGLRGAKAEKERRINDLLDRVDLAGYNRKYPHELSGGEQQRVALARALAPKPRVLLMDEPFSGLDDRLRDDVRDATLELLKDEGSAVLLVTHEPVEAMRMADKIALMRDGQVVQMGAPYNIYNAPVDKAAAAFFSDINVVSGVVKNALTNTPFGQFLVPGSHDGDEVEIIIRPQHLRLDFDRDGRGPNPTTKEGTPARGIVSRARYLGHYSLVEFTMDYDGSQLQVTVPGVFLPERGRPLWLSMRRDRCFVFPKT
ncbi:ABC transporter ATP-binding protein [Neptunicoccus cionae]|uniref:ABC transporter ATP-binding protein n=1 Tax=Neptunicoccus cionae TaxID=2035344 RepID=UPI000C760CF5|nr:ABC transporter ATP-binding protein [Amylibacter cionae]PLS22092.1 Fe3+/spermidine/putrescine ABC transporter ATP-binding protein [Amylibacter cionae]